MNYNVGVTYFLMTWKEDEIMVSDILFVSGIVSVLAVLYKALRYTIRVIQFIGKKDSKKVMRVILSSEGLLSKRRKYFRSIYKKLGDRSEFRTLMNSVSCLDAFELHFLEVSVKAVVNIQDRLTAGESILYKAWEKKSEVYNDNGEIKTRDLADELVTRELTIDGDMRIIDFSIPFVCSYLGISIEEYNLLQLRLLSTGLVEPFGGAFLGYSGGTYYPSGISKDIVSSFSTRISVDVSYPIIPVI